MKFPGQLLKSKKERISFMNTHMAIARNMIITIMLLRPAEKMTVRHLFDIASLTKVVGTTTSIMLLADRGSLDVDDPVCRYIKCF